MGKKPEIDTISSGYNSSATLNANFQALRDAFENTISRDGSSPNTMIADFDLNNNDLLNGGEASFTNLTIGGVSIAAQVAAAAASAAAALASEIAAASSASDASTSETNAAASESAASASESAAASSASNASSSASAASTSEINAAASESAAAGSASAASTSESNAASSASAASTSASNAATSESNAAASEASAANLYDAFDDRYLGDKASDPTLDNDGNALLTGALYFNTSSNEMRVYDGASWVAAYIPLSTALLVSNNLSDLDNVSTARSNLGLEIGVDVEAYDATILKDADIGSTVQGYDVNTAKYDDITANFTGTLQNGGSNVLVDSDIGSSVADASHSHAIGDVTGLQSALDGKAATSHTHNASDINAGTLATARLPASVVLADTDDTLTAGYAATADDDGTQSSGTYTPTYAGGNLKKIVNGGAFTFAAPTASGDYTMIVAMTNNGSAGAVTFTGFDIEEGDSLTTTNAEVFFLYITKLAGKVLLSVRAMQ